MLKRAIWLSLAIHLAVVLSLSRLVLQPYSQRVGATLAERAPVLVGQTKGFDGERSAPAVGPSARVAQSPAKRAPLPKRPVAENFNFGQFLPSTVKSSAQPEPIVPPATGAPASMDSSVLPGLLGQFRLELARNARPYKSYPASARENGWEGRVVIVVAYPFGNGRPLASVEHSSGHAALDRQALEMVERALSSTRLPDALQGRAFVVSLSIEYRLAE